MKSVTFCFLFFFILCGFISCKQKSETEVRKETKSENTIRYAKGLSIFKYNGFSVVTISNPWPNATKDYIYILQQKGVEIPDSLKQNIVIPVPLKSIVVTSTTHISSLEMLGVESTLIGFPNLEYISSERTRSLIDAKKIHEVGSNQNLNTEAIIDLQPNLIVGYGIDNNNPTLENLQKNGLKVMLNGDWNEQTPLGKAEWIKFFGALYGLDAKAESIFNKIETDYKETLTLASKATTKPSVLAGAIFENQWYLPQGNSWNSTFVNDAAGNYLWRDTSGTGSLSLSFEAVLEKAQNADFWIGPAQFTSLQEMSLSNPHYTQFAAFKNKKVYSFSTKKGKTGGVIFYEIAPNRPDLVLKDMLKILHPELLPDYNLYFFEQLQ